MQITPLTDGRRPILVASHERSGTHFTMNTIGNCFGYISAPWLDLDRHHVNINYFSPVGIANTLTSLAERRPPANVVKSHHASEFFAEIVDTVAAAYHLVYVYRNPADCLASFWRLLNSMPWVDGPKCATLMELATSPPMGRILCYQYYQRETMLDRWAAHVRGWVDLAAHHDGVHLVRYEDLANDFEGAVRDLGARIGQEPRAIERPSATENVVSGGPLKFEPAPGADNRAAVTELAVRTYPDLMERLGYR